MQYILGGHTMRRNRTKARKNSNTNKTLTTIVFIILLPIISVSIGYFGTKYIIIPKFFSQDSYSENQEVNQETEKLAAKEEGLEETNNEEAREEKQESSEENNTGDNSKTYVVEAPPLNIFSVQVGSFNDLNHAQALVEELKTKGLDGYIIKSGNYKTIARSFLDREKAEKYKEVVRQEYSDAFILSISIAKRPIHYGEEGKSYGEGIIAEINKLINFYNHYYSFLSNNELNSLNRDSKITFIDQSIDKLNNIESSISQMNPTSDFNKLHQNLLNITKTTKNDLLELKNEESITEKRLWRTFVGGINKYIDLV